MQPSTEPLPFDPGKFIQKNPNDPRLRDALKQISELVQRIAPPQLDETALDARRRIEQGFDKLEEDLTERLKRDDARQREGYREAFLVAGKKAINLHHQTGIDAATNLELKVGGQIERDKAVERFEAEIDSNPTLKAEMDSVVQRQAARQDAVFHTLNSACQNLLKQHGLDLVEAPVPPAPSDNVEVLKGAPIQSEDFKAALHREMAAIEEMKRNEQLLPEMPQFNRAR